MGIFNNDFEPWPEEKFTGDRSMHWSDEDEELYQKELKRKKEDDEEGLHFHNW